MRKRLQYLIYLSMLILSAGCIGCSEEASQSAQHGYKTLCVKKQDFTLYRELAAKIESKNNISVHSVISGRLEKICVKEGARVKKGQTLFILNQEPYVAAINSAKAQVATARAALSSSQLNLEGKEKLYAKQMIGEFDMQRARHTNNEAIAQLEAAIAELAAAQANLNFTVIKSPVDGVINMIEYREGELIDPSSDLELTTIGANKSIYSYSAISEETLIDFLKEYGCGTTAELIEKLPEVSLYTNWGKELPQKGRIDAISGTVHFKTGAISVRASFNNPSEMFSNGGNGYIVIPCVKRNVIVIPQEAAADIDNKYIVYRVVKGKAVATEVKVVPYNDGQNFVVTEGLTPGDIIIAEGAGLLSDGMEVVVSKESKEEK